ncbi:MAG: hypothetical protein IKW96_07010 [Ruminococcus sp.]|uniref:hypothetical protein n=1 Tax=Ruminococcus sp. TaxID=41978 RepID=UPI0025D73047|nr:hypothetical protein [Ruminococcus sp.]MBR5683013.1 hypothetical protein [Ruminococcus sp.]
MDKRAVAAAVLSCCALLACGCSAKKSSHKEKKDDRPTTWAVEQRSIEEVTPLRGEEDAFVTRDENDTVRLIQGVLGNEPVKDEKSALDFIASFSQEMGFNDVYSEMRFSGTTDYGDRLDYRFDQYYSDMEVIGSYIELTVDKSDGYKPIIINSTYSDTWEFSTKPRVSPAVAVKCAADNYKVSKDAVPRLAIYSGPVLTWIVPVKDDKIGEVYIDASNGNTFHRELKVSQ